MKETMTEESRKTLYNMLLSRRSVVKCAIEGTGCTIDLHKLTGTLRYLDYHIAILEEVWGSEAYCETREAWERIVDDLVKEQNTTQKVD